jgi:PAS domain S-box-containing protein
MTNLLSTSKERVYFKDLTSRFLFVSEGWVEAYTPGRATEELTGKTDFDVFTEDHASAAFADEQEIIRTGVPLVGKVERETYPGRPDAWVSTTKMPLRDTRGEIIGTFGITRDITPQISAEHALAHQAGELSAQNERLRELDRLKDEFVALVSHELRTPLTSIIGYIQLLRDERASGLDTDHFAEVIERNAERLLRLVGDLLFLSQMQSGRLALELRDTDLAGLAADAVEEARPEAERKHVDLALSTAPVPHLTVDPTRIAQLLGNLVSNAVKFTPEGGTVEVSLAAEDGEAVLSVADTGIGIRAADRERIFERFFRTEAATQRVIPGSGLGLTISRAIVDAHRGMITVRSDGEHGSTFTVRLPLASEPLALAPLALAPVSSPQPAVCHLLLMQSTDARRTRGTWTVTRLRALSRAARTPRRRARCPPGRPARRPATRGRSGQRTRCSRRRWHRRSWRSRPTSGAAPRSGWPAPPGGPSRPRTSRCPPRRRRRRGRRCPPDAAGR